MDLLNFRKELLDEINENRLITTSTFEEEFFNTYVNYLEENDEIMGDPVFLHFEMPLSRQQKVKISGYAYNDVDGILYLFIIDEISYSEEIETLNLADAERLVKKAINFYQFSDEIVEYGEESNEAVALAYDLLFKDKENSWINNLKKIKVIVFTDKKISRSLLKTNENLINNIIVNSQFVGIERIQNLSQSRKGREDLEIDLNEFQYIPAIKANETADYESYLCNINGLTLAELYNKFGSRLIESNVRSFLQIKGNVNKGIRLTILKEPEKFFAYNNGLTCTAKYVQFDNNVISKIVGLQIVNGGQTTASLANILQNEKSFINNLKNVFVPMKLNIVKNLSIEDELVPSISRYANSQNKVSDVDLASNHPFHKKIEELSRKTTTPAADGFSHGTYWYYERAAGQYSQETYKMAKSHRNKFYELHPKNQMFKKSDLAKYHCIKNQQPHIASKGGQTAFKELSNWIISVWDKNSNFINQEFYKETISIIIIFKNLDKITKLGAGKLGYKANINAYTISLLLWYIEKSLNKKFDYSKIWQKQGVPDNVLNFLEELSYYVRDFLVNTEGNVTEYAKKPTTWINMKEIIRIPQGYNLNEIIMSTSEHQSVKRQAKKEEKQINELNITTFVYSKLEANINYYIDLLYFIKLRDKIFSKKEIDIIALIATNKYLSDKQCKIVVDVINKAELEGFGL